MTMGYAAGCIGKCLDEGWRKMMELNKEESYRIQLVRALGIIAVVGIHTCGGVSEALL